MQELSLQILPKSHNYSSLRLNLPWPRSELISELEQQEWRAYGMDTSVKHNVWTGQRFKVIFPDTPRLQQISDFFRQDNTRRYLIDCLYRDRSDLQVNWQMYPWRMAQNTVLHAEFTKDMPGFENGIHCDMRRLVATGMIYLCDGNDPDQASAFYDTPDRQSEQIVETGYGLGWVHSNNWNTWHDGWNRTDQIRYSILLALTLQLKHQPDSSDQAEDSLSN